MICWSIIENTNPRDGKIFGVGLDEAGLDTGGPNTNIIVPVSVLEGST